MPKALRTKKLGKKRSSKTTRNSHVSHVKGEKRSSTGKNIVDTFEAWIDNQAKGEKYSTGNVNLSKALEMPVSSTDKWLAEQKVFEKEEQMQVKIPLGTTEEWLQSQVSARLLKEKEEAAVETTLASETVIVTSEITPNTVETQETA